MGQPGITTNSTAASPAMNAPEGRQNSASESGSPKMVATAGMERRDAATTPASAMKNSISSFLW